MSSTLEVPPTTSEEFGSAARWLRGAVREGALDLPLPGRGCTVERFDRLRRIAAQDPVHGRLAEGHVDAVAILQELRGPAPGEQVWGVWAAVPKSLQARRTATGWVVVGERPWCSGAAVCTAALVTAAAPDGVRLFAVDLTTRATAALPGTWPAIGMAGSDSRTVRFDEVPALPVGAPGDYTRRAGFWHGAVGVAACWHGAAQGVARALHRAVEATENPDPHLLAHLGAVDARLFAAQATLDRVAARIDAEPRADLRVEAMRVRAVVEETARDVLDRTGRALGAAPLCMDAAHAKRAADLTVYLRQHHGERDLAELGALVARGSAR